MTKFILPDEIIENIEVYEKIVLDLANLFLEIGIGNDPIKVAEAFYFMYNGEYLSANRQFISSVPPQFRILENVGFLPIDVLGMAIIACYGVCRHLTDFLNHLYSRLGFLSSQLFVYDPIISMDIAGERGVSNSVAQEYIDEIMKSIDVFSPESTTIERDYDGVLIKVAYEPSEVLLNHTINVVKSQFCDTIFIFDALNHYVGKNIDESRSIELADVSLPGYKKYNYVQNYPRFSTYYPPRYGLGWNLFRDYRTDDLGKSLEQAVDFYNQVDTFKSAFERFSKEHEREYKIVRSNLFVLERTLNEKCW